MSKFFFGFLNLLILISLSVPGISLQGQDSSDIEGHLKEYSKYSVNHHESIDDSSEEHTHTHKHSEDDDEHEHNHSHSKGLEITMKTIFGTPSLMFKFNALAQEPSFSDENLFSNPHPFGIFRPPKS